MTETEGTSPTGAHRPETASECGDAVEVIRKANALLAMEMGFPEDPELLSAGVRECAALAREQCEIARRL